MSSPDSAHDRLARIDAYIERLFGGHDPVLAQNLLDAEAAGLPAINVSANQGRLLYLIARIAGARRILEVGTLGGYSTTWLARAVPADGVVVTLEVDPGHAEVAARNLSRAALPVKVDIRIGPAADAMQRMIDAREAPFDLIFIDADKPSYPTYLPLAIALSRPGSVILADNVIRDGRVIDAVPVDENARGARAFNAALSADTRLESTIIPLVRHTIDGMSMSIVR